MIKQLTYWKVAENTYWFQARTAEFAKQPDKHKNSKLVAWSVGGGYLKTYELPHLTNQEAKSVYRSLTLN
jgi:hypothetical protein